MHGRIRTFRHNKFELENIGNYLNITINPTGILPTSQNDINEAYSQIHDILNDDFIKKTIEEDEECVDEYDAINTPTNNAEIPNAQQDKSECTEGLTYAQNSCNCPAATTMHVVSHGYFVCKSAAQQGIPECTENSPNEIGACRCPSSTRVQTTGNNSFVCVPIAQSGTPQNNSGTPCTENLVQRIERDGICNLITQECTSENILEDIEDASYAVCPIDENNDGGATDGGATSGGEMGGNSGCNGHQTNLGVNGDQNCHSANLNKCFPIERVLCVFQDNQYMWKACESGCPQ
ncbi:MAG: hypothetical protein KBD78_07420 [Oligoflexales bacterium]|nr:hypothetical protein [Oligoflexales bacterium]